MQLYEVQQSKRATRNGYLFMQLHTALSTSSLGRAGTAQSAARAACAVMVPSVHHLSRCFDSHLVVNGRKQYEDDARLRIAAHQARNLQIKHYPSTSLEGIVAADAQVQLR